MADILPPGARIGILGGGQLGLMLSLAAARLGYRTAIFCPDPESPAFRACDRFWQASYQDRSALAEFADAVDLISFEFENVPAPSLDFLSARQLFNPGSRLWPPAGSDAGKRFPVPARYSRGPLS